MLAQIKCPNCGTVIDIEEALAHDIEGKYREKFQKEQEQLRLTLKEKEKVLLQKEEQFEETRKRANEEFSRRLNEKLQDEKKRIEEEKREEYRMQIAKLQQETDDRARKLMEYEQRALEMAEKEREFTRRQQEAEIEMKKLLAEKEDEIRKEAERMAMQKAELSWQEKANELKRKQEESEMELQRRLLSKSEEIRQEESLKQRELQKQLEDQKKLIEEMKKKSEQGSMQLQGEVQELALEQMLRQTFPYDLIEEVGKGVKGGDLVQTVRTPYGEHCGTIIYESKRTMHFSADWIEKLKADQRAKGAEIAVIVTSAMPKDMEHFGFKDGVWICSFTEVKSVAQILRDGLQKVQQALMTRENIGDKKQLLYEFLTGTEFKQHIEAIVEGFMAMKQGLDREKMAMDKIWKEREKQIMKVLQNTSRLYGSIRGIAGTAVGEVRALELGETETDSETPELHS